ncbi:hyaluronidase-1-like [Tachypleus tridentatus]|uniref:hyaluronidase-1-like n=1 Tax=Tachypleus tridentatus TaxID=6853 RepID=UPI003FD4CD69
MQIKLSLICCLTFILLISLDEYAAEEDINFKVFWNVPSYICSKKYGINVTDSLRKFGVLVNTAEKFRGDSITIFYAKDLGLYPRIEEGSYINGGHPQLSDMNKHLEKAKNDIETKIPSKDFDGLAVIDWESWRPVWEYNWGGFRQYQTISRELVKNNIQTGQQKKWTRKLQLNGKRLPRFGCLIRYSWVKLNALLVNGATIYFLTVTIIKIKISQMNTCVEKVL